MSRDHVVIVGASTAGLLAAYLLAKERIPVQLYDERESLGQPHRTLIVTSKLIQVLGFVPHGAILNRVNRIELVSARRRSIVELGQADLVIERQKLIELLAKKASEEGAEIHLGFKFLGFEDEGERLVASLANHARGETLDVVTNVLIGADGALSDVAQAAARDSRETVAIAQAKVMLTEKNSADCVKVWFDKRRTEFFYWLIPESKRTGVIGLIAKNTREAMEGLEEFLPSQRCEVVEFQSAQVSLHKSFLELSRSVSKSRILLIGDAGGQVKATTVGGVVAGLRGARAAVKAVVGQTPYRKTVRPLKRELDLHSLMRAILTGFGDGDYDLLLESLNPGTKGVLGRYNRDELKQALFRLLVAQPRLLFLAAKSLLRMRNLE